MNSGRKYHMHISHINMKKKEICINIEMYNNNSSNNNQKKNRPVFLLDLVVVVGFGVLPHCWSTGISLSNFFVVVVVWASSSFAVQFRHWC